jgi:TetR/AcrR family transcriptional regulator, regulator of autoinduction and epiphytic fitness
VSVRSVFQHFDDLEALYAAVADRMVERLSHLMTTVDVDAPLDVRLTDVVYQRSLLLEAITPIRRAAAVHAPFSAEVTARLQSGHDFLRSEVERLFEHELSRREGADRVRLLDALDTVLSWPSWENLRTLNHRSVTEARAVLHLAIRALLGPPP